MTTTYTLEYADGRASDIVADTDREAVRAALARVDIDGAVVADDWDQAGWDDEQRPQERLLIWASEADADPFDSGSKAIAEIIRSKTD